MFFTSKKIKIGIKKLRNAKGLPLPKYMTEFSSGMDLYAAVKSDIIIKPHERVLIPTGIKIVLPKGYEAQIRPRSGLALNYGLTILNSPGTVDADYRGEVKIILINHGSKPHIIKRGERVAQMIISPVIGAEIEVLKSVPRTKRNKDGFGSTGR